MNIANQKPLLERLQKAKEKVVGYSKSDGLNMPVSSWDNWTQWSQFNQFGNAW